VSFTLVQQELLTIWEYMSPPWDFCRLWGAQFSVLCVVFCGSLLVFLSFSCSHCIVCPSTIYPLLTPLVSLSISYYYHAVDTTSNALSIYRMHILLVIRSYRLCYLTWNEINIRNKNFKDRWKNLWKLWSEQAVEKMT
jgi:hypothetical protein